MQIAKFRKSGSCLTIKVLHPNTVTTLGLSHTILELLHVGDFKTFATLKDARRLLLRNLCIQINVYHYRYFLQTLPPVLLHVRPQKRRTHCLLHLQNPFLPMCRTKNVLTSLLLFSSVSWDRKQHLQFRALSAKEAQELLPSLYRIPYFTDIKPRPRHNNNTARRTGGLAVCALMEMRFSLHFSYAIHYRATK